MQTVKVRSDIPKAQNFFHSFFRDLLLFLIILLIIASTNRWENMPVFTTKSLVEIQMHLPVGKSFSKLMCTKFFFFYSKNIYLVPVMCYAQGNIMMIRNKRKHLGAQWLEHRPGGQGRRVQVPTPAGIGCLPLGNH